MNNSEKELLLLIHLKFNSQQFLSWECILGASSMQIQ